MKRVLKFKVEEQELSKDPSCSFEGIVSGTKGYLTAKFSFNRAWSGYARIAVFKKLLEEYPVPLKNDCCDIPEGALDWDKFSVKVIGRKDGSHITSNEVVVCQNRGGDVV